MTDKQKLFVQHYCIHMNASAAYREAGYTVTTEQAAASCAYKLLRNAEVADAIDKAQVERMERLKLDGDWVIERFRLVYLRSMQDKDYSAAIKALDCISRHLGLYEKHNSQKRLTQADADALQTMLVEQYGMSFERKNAPAWLKERPLYVAPQLVSLTPPSHSEG